MSRSRSLRWCLFLLSLLALGLVGLSADSRQAPEPFSARDEHRPTPVPDRIVLTWTGDPARTQAVTWRTDTTVKKALAQIAPAADGPKFVADAQSFPAFTTPFTSDLGEAHYHTVQFENLKPGTRYAYRVGDGVHWSAWIQFRTASDRPEPFSFIYFGDAQNDLKAHWSRVIREAYSEASRARFIIHAGDLINRANRDAEWGEWFQAGGWVNAMVPSVPTPGNHEYERNQEGKSELSRHWRPQFALPENGPPGLEETVYYLDYQGVRIVSLNSNQLRAEQMPWLEKVLAANPMRWTVLTFHHPIYSAAKDRDNAELRRLWQPVFDRGRVDLVLTGHDHAYARSGLRQSENLATGAAVRDPQSGTVYVVSVSGPKMYRLEQRDWMQSSAQDTQLYQVIHVDGDRLKYAAYTAAGRLHDSFELVKRPGRPNELIEGGKRAGP